MDILNDINGYSLSEEQRNVVYCQAKSILVIAGAGSGKTLTIVGKIKYLMEVEKLDAKDILVISFTNEACLSLKKKVNYDIDILTFHKLALNILRNISQDISVAAGDELDYVIKIFLESTILAYPYLVKIILKYSNIRFNKYNYLKKYLKFLQEEQYLKLIKTISVFINLVKANNYNNESFKGWIIKEKKKERFLLIIIYAIYLEYEKELASRLTIDFNDMINKATEVSKYPFKYKYIIVDEFQDTSKSRYCLLKRLVDNLQAKLMVVGDDWQSIYGFNGCSLDVFLNFSNYFPNSKILYLNHTYRNPQGLIDIAGKFIMQNPWQLRKKLLAIKDLNEPLKFIYYKNIKDDLTKLIIDLNKEGSLFILGRNNQDIYRYLDLKLFQIDKNGNIIFKNKTDYFVRFLTVHKAKGLESDNVIIINLENATYGFPNKVIEEKILNYVKKYDEYPLAEERRLFYVALTRSKNRIYFYLPKRNVSKFIKEIKKLP